MNGGKTVFLTSCDPISWQFLCFIVLFFYYCNRYNVIPTCCLLLDMLRVKVVCVCLCQPLNLCRCLCVCANLSTSVSVCVSLCQPCSERLDKSLILFFMQSNFLISNLLAFLPIYASPSFNLTVGSKVFLRE